MGYKNDDTVLDNTAEDEPIFVLVARDVNAISAIEDWIHSAELSQINEVKIDEARRQLERFSEWQTKHGTDLPD
jgi:glutaredoxin-related protein